MAQTLGFGDLQNQGQQDPNQQQNQQQGQQQSGQQQSSAPTQTPGAGQQGSQSGGGNAGAGAATASGGTANAGSQYKPAAYSQQTQGTGFTNLQQYLNANNPTQLQNAVVSNIGSQNQTAANNLGQAQQSFQQQTAANQANTGANQSLIQNVLNNPTAYSNATGANITGAGTPNGNAPASTAGVSPNLAQGSQFSQLIGGQYAGPTGLSNASQLTAQGTAAAQQAANLGSAGGRTSILQGMMANPNYTQGDAALDSSLLGQGNQTALNQAANQARGLQNTIATANAGATAQGQEAASNAQQFGQQVQGQLTNTVQNQLSNLQNQAASQQQQQTAQYNQMLSDLQSGNVTQQEANMLGLTQGEQVYNTLQNPSTYLAANPLKANAQNVATAQQYAQMQALQQLAGSSAPTGATSVFQQFANPSQAGTFANTPAAVANQQAFQNILGQTQQQYQTTLNPAQQSLNQAQNLVNMYNQQAALGLSQTQVQQDENAIAAAGYGAVGSTQGAQGGAFQTGGTTASNYEGDRGWAGENLNTQQQNYNNVLAGLTAQYGPGETINIGPQGQTNAPTIGPQLNNLLTDNANAYNVT